MFRTDLFYFTRRSQSPLVIALDARAIIFIERTWGGFCLARSDRSCYLALVCKLALPQGGISSGQRLLPDRVAQGSFFVLERLVQAWIWLPVLSSIWRYSYLLPRPKVLRLVHGGRLWLLHKSRLLVSPRTPIVTRRQLVHPCHVRFDASETFGKRESVLCGWL